jgi:glycine/D-amino acid oxidase-like deaminating enzyme
MAATRYGVPWWLEGVPRARRPVWPRLRGELRAEVAIVGGGLAGCAAAFAFAHTGASVVLLEAGRVGLGATAGSPGILDPGAGTTFRDLRERYGLRAARQMWEMERQAALELQAVVRRQRLRCDLARVGVVDVALDETAAHALQQEREALAEAGLEAAWISGARAEALTGLPARGVLKRPEAAVVDPYRLAAGLARRAEARGAALFEQSPVRRIRFGRRDVEVATGHGIVRAEVAVVATGRPAPGLTALHRHVRAIDHTVARVPPLPAPIRRGLGSGTAVIRDLAVPRHGWRVKRDGALLVWQGDQETAPERRREAATVQRVGQLMYELSVLYPHVSGVQPSHGWTARQFRSHDGLVIAGAHRAFPRHLFAVGLGADGIQGAWLAARLLVRAHRGAPDKADALFGFIR